MYKSSNAINNNMILGDKKNNHNNNINDNNRGHSWYFTPLLNTNIGYNYFIYPIIQLFLSF